MPLSSVSPISAVMIHVGNVEQGLRWYQQAFPEARRAVAPGTGFEFLQLAQVHLELVPSDPKVASGPAGSVVYWRVCILHEAIRHFRSLGAQLYRGPMPIEDGLGICQVRDPWGNCIGLRGAYEAESTP